MKLNRGRGCHQVKETGLKASVNQGHTKFQDAALTKMGCKGKSLLSLWATLLLSWNMDLYV